MPTAERPPISNRGDDDGRISLQRPRVLGVPVVILILLLLLVAGGVKLALTLGTGAVNPSATALLGVLSTGGTRRAGAVAVRPAANWVSQQVSPNSVVACDPAMCSALEAQGEACREPANTPSSHAGSTPSAGCGSNADGQEPVGRRLDSVYAPSVIVGFGSRADRVVCRFPRQAVQRRTLRRSAGMTRPEEGSRDPTDGQ